ncbi:MAG: TIGR03936 family radical SAM-associated protein, partial [Desulfuromonadaceae bacterium]|nr:TIGR03936 family radical SAM-associated protein [Desulfuromonadaceae bacterium]
RAVELGCRFDGWREHFSMKLWLQAFADCGIDPAWYLRRRELGEVLPWDHIDCGITRDFLLSERSKALSESATEDCRDAACSSCGVCDFDKLKNRVSGDATLQPRTPVSATQTEAVRMRLRFAKDGAMRYLSHLELITVFTRAVSRGDVPILFSQGFHPHPRFSFGTATSVGVESEAEYMDMYIEAGISAEDVKFRLNSVLPKGLRILDSKVIDAKSPSISTLIDATCYRISMATISADELPQKCVQFLAHDSFLIQRTKKGQTQTVDLKAETVSLSCEGDKILLVARRGKPLEFARAISGNNSLEGNDILVKKQEVVFSA